MKRALMVFLMLSLLTVPALAGERPPVEPEEKDRCPVCGMFVVKYPEFLSQIIFKDGSYGVFDGVKDMLKYYFNLPKYQADKEPADIDSIYVKDYYSLRYIDGLKAYYVMGSKVYGPMGKELIPFEKEEDAMEFMVDHSGKQLLRFEDITQDTLTELDR